MLDVRIEWIPIQKWALGLFGFDHLMLTLETGYGAPQGEWLSLEGTLPADQRGLIGVDGKSGRETLYETQGAATIADNKKISLEAALEFLIGTPASRGSRILPTFDAFSAWQTMAAHAQQIDNEFPYITNSVPGTVRAASNSSSVVASVMWAAGLDLHQNMPLGIRITTGIHTLLGTRAPDEMTVTKDFYILHGGRGADVLIGDEHGNKLFGGRGNDLLRPGDSRFGIDVVHGGQLKYAYEKDGTDTVDFTGTKTEGVIRIKKNEDRIENILFDYVVSSGLNVHHLYSIERIQWTGGSDRLVLEDGAAIIEDGLLFKMGADGGDEGDVVDFSLIQEALVIAPSGPGQLQVRLASGSGEPDAALWIEDAESIVGSAGDDRIYLDASMRVVDGGDGDDLIDASRIDQMEGDSPAGFDVEIDGGAGDDTIIAANARSLLSGGAGADRFVLTRLTPMSDGAEEGDAGGGTAPGTVEVIITDAGTEDRLFMLHSLFDGSGLPDDQGQLMPVLGGFGIPDSGSDEIFGYYDWRLESHLFFGTDQTQGLITFVGAIEYAMDDLDLVMHIHRGRVVDEVSIDESGTITRYRWADIDWDTQTLLRVKNFSDGMLGLQFHLQGEGEYVDLGEFGGGIHYPNWDAAVRAMTGDGILLPGLPERPTTTTPPPEESEDDSPEPAQHEGTGQGEAISVLSGGDAVVLSGGGGDTVTTGDGDDVLDGQEGDDTLAGGDGDDIYFVDSTGDTVVEAPSEGDDVVYASVSFAIPENVETLVLGGDARIATGSAAADILVGSEVGNDLLGNGGNDRLVGGEGDDRLVGGSGSDTYHYALGDGFDVIADAGLSSDHDKLVLGSGITPDDVTVLTDLRTPDDVVLVVRAMGSEGEIRLEAFASGAAATIEEVVFENGARWTAADIATAVAAGITRDNAAPTSLDDPYFYTTGTQLLISGADLLRNDVDRDGDTLAIVSVHDADQGSVALQADGNILFTIDAMFEGAATFAYTVDDGHGGQASARAQVVVNASVTGRTITGTAAADVLTGFGAADRLSGLAGDDIVTGQSGNDRLFGGLGNDILSGGEGIDYVYGEDGEDLLDGVAGERAGGEERDSLKGGRGDDTYIVNMDRVFESASEGFDTVIAMQNWRLGAGVEVEVIEAGAAGVTDVRGNEFGQTLRNAAGVAATLRGRGGDDVLEGADGDDVLWGDDGASRGTSVGNDTLRGGAGADRLYGEAGDDHLDGGDGNDRLLGGTGHDTLIGGAGVDVLLGEAGDDVLDGITGDDASGGTPDVLRGGTGDDTYWVDADRIYETAGEGFDTVIAFKSWRLSAGAEIEVVEAGSSAVAHLYGNEFAQTVRNTIGTATMLHGMGGDDVVIGGGGNDRLYGGAGDDSLEAGAGRDTLDGGDGDDVLMGGLGGDRFYFRANFGNDVILDLDADDVIDLRGLGLAHADLSFTEVEGGILVSAAALGDANTITVLGAFGPLSDWQLVL